MKKTLMGLALLLTTAALFANGQKEGGAAASPRR